MLSGAFKLAAISGCTTIINASGWGDLVTVELYELYVSRRVLTDDMSFRCTIGCTFQEKLHETLKEHEGQLYATMHACREQYLRTKLKKRKSDTDPMIQVHLIFGLPYHDNMLELEFEFP